jgi:tripartite-type tricarboxylate transporter receptor subunit TctC
MKEIVIGLAALLITATSLAQPSAYPNRPVKMVAPFAPGGPVDVVARVLAPKLSEGLGQQFYVENHPGGSGNIGTALVAKAPPDGHTVLVISSTLVVNPSLFAKLGFDTTTDLAPVSLVGVAGASPRSASSRSPARPRNSPRGSNGKSTNGRRSFAPPASRCSDQDHA